jgi:hypothetical protein
MVSTASPPALNQRLHSTELLSYQPLYLKDRQARRYSHIHWQRQPGYGIPVRLLPSVNATGKQAYDIQSLTGHAVDTETRTLPNALDQLFRELVSVSHFLEPVAEEPDYYVQFHVRRYDSLYALGKSDHLLSLGFAHIDRSWSQIFGDDKPATVSITLMVYNRDYDPLLEIPVTVELDPCQRSGNPMLFSPRVNQSFFNAYATTTTGQATIAAVNRALDAASQFFAALPIRGQVVKVNENEIFINLGSGVVYPREQLQLLYDDGTGTPYPVSRLEVEQVWQQQSLVHALDVFSGQVKVGDQIVLNKVIQQRQWVSAGDQKVSCLTPKTKNPFALDKVQQQGDHGFTWQLADDED